MGILSASSTLFRYRILDEIPQELWPQLPDLLLANAFQEIDHTSDERSFGWVNIDNMLDNEWSGSPPFKGEYAAFALRLDTRQVPAAVLKKYYQIAFEDKLAQKKEQGKPYLSKQEKKEIREQVKSRLLAKTLPVPAVFDVVLNTQTSRVYFCSTKQKVREMFEELFFNTFNLHLEPLKPYYLAEHSLGSESQELLQRYSPEPYI